jgi:hypothetical protein
MPRQDLLNARIQHQTRLHQRAEAFSHAERVPKLLSDRVLKRFREPLSLPHFSLRETSANEQGHSKRPLFIRSHLSAQISS